MRLDTAGSKLTHSIDTGATTLAVATTRGPCWVDSVMHPSEFPFRIRVDGEVMTVIAIAESSSPQTFTVTRSADAWAHEPGAPVRVAESAVW